MQKLNLITLQYSFFFFSLKLEQGLDSKPNIETAVCEVSESPCKYFSCPGSLPYFLWEGGLI